PGVGSRRLQLDVHHNRSIVAVKIRRQSSSTLFPYTTLFRSALEQFNRMIGKEPKTVSVDRGYRGNTQIGATQVQIPKPFNDKKHTKYLQKKLKEAHRKRAAIEPVIGHLKTDHRLGRNFYKGIIGDNINIMLAAAGECKINCGNG